MSHECVFKDSSLIKMSAASFYILAYHVLEPNRKRINVIIIHGHWILCHRLETSFRPISKLSIFPCITMGIMILFGNLYSFGLHWIKISLRAVFRAQTSSKPTFVGSKWLNPLLVATNRAGIITMHFLPC